MGRKGKDIKGQRFGSLVAIKSSGKKDSRGLLWHCKCDCGTWVEVPYGRLSSGNTKSCGCLRKKARKKKAAVAGRTTRIVGGKVIGVANTEDLGLIEARRYAAQAKKLNW